MTIFLVPIYIAEIASDEIRGKLGSFLPFALSLGILLAFIFGVVMSYQMFAVCGMILPLVFISGFTFMPETPVFLLRKSGVEAATRSLLWLRHGDKAVVEEELARLKQSIEDSQSVKSGGFRDVLKNRGTIKGFLIALVLLPGQQASGNPVVFAYSATIFQLSGSSLSPNTSAIVLGAVQLAASFLPTMMIERFGRRVLLLFSCGGMAICHWLLGLFLLLQTWHYDLWFCRWAPIMLLCLFTTFYSIGLGPLAYVVVSEVLSSETRAVVNSMAMTATWIIAFLVVKGFPLLAESSIGSYGCFFAFGFSCTCTFLVTYIIIPETKGKSVDYILRELNATAIKSEDDFRGNSIEIKSDTFDHFLLRNRSLRYQQRDNFCILIKLYKLRSNMPKPMNFITIVELIRNECIHLINVNKYGRERITFIIYDTESWQSIQYAVGSNHFILLVINTLFVVSATVPGKWRQFMATMIVNLAPFLSGVSYGWCSTTIPSLVRDDTPLGTTPLTDEEASWLISSLAIGPLIIFLFSASFCERFGRKATGLVIALPSTTSWLLILFATNFYQLLIAQILQGIAAALATFHAPLYITEIASVDIRGQLGSFFLFSVKIGLLSSYILGSVLSYHVFAMCCLLIPICHFGGLLVLPETPVYLIRKIRIEEATRSLMWLRGNDKPAVELEINRLRASVDDKIDIAKSANIRDIFTDRGNFKALVIAVMLAIGQQSCGISVLLTSTVVIFNLAKSSVDPYVATIIFGVMQVIGAWLSTLTMERAGRRILLLVSSSGMAVCHCILGTFLLIQNFGYDMSAISWTPVIVLSGFSILYCIGVGPIAHVVPNEVYSPDLASISNSITLFIMTCCGFLVLKLFSVAVSVVELHGCFFIFMVFCMGTFLFAFLNIPETKGKTLESIRKELVKTKKKPEEVGEAVVMQPVTLDK
ncbi:facilitated trehalose transporter Tret1-like [Diachasmimorpha longicaudata]|uniref:facilitated trehalose transporter Tret1-like n=1 Tax=Diachasmimorpha longicaudata TaxID=58733 RepID=UPI0030B86B1C